MESDFYAPEEQSRRPERRAPKKKKSAFSFVSFLLLMLILGGTALGAWRVQEYEAFAEMKAVVARMTFGAGVTVEGVDVSDMTLNQALDYWNTQIEPAQREIAAVLNDGTRVTAAQMGYSSDYESVLSSAWSAGKRGSLEERYRHLQQQSQQRAAYDVTRSYYDPQRVAEFAQSAAAQIDREAQDAHIKSFDFATTSFRFEEGQNGYRLNQEMLTSDIAAVLSNGGGSVKMQVEAFAPAVTLDNISSQYGLITTATTNASSSSSNRLSNIAQALSFVNGKCLQPGETFSFNETVGQRTESRGFKVATAYSGGTVTEEVGGGICQVSTTLFNAAVKANLKIKERHSHSLTVSYVDIGKDAAVDWGNKDLKFTNSSDSPIYIVCGLTDDKHIRVGIFGKLLPDGMTITVESKKTGDVKYETEYQLNFRMGSGQEKVVQQGKNGTTAVAYKVLWDANGNEVKREELCRSTYKATPRIVQYGA